MRLRPDITVRYFLKRSVEIKIEIPWAAKAGAVAPCRIGDRSGVRASGWREEDWIFRHRCSGRDLREKASMLAAVVGAACDSVT
jgi:hypothetical protein